VRAFCRRISQQYKEIAVLVNNAGRNTSGVSQEGDHKLDLLFQSNFLGHFLLTAELLPLLLKSSSTARIVNLSSVMHHFCAGSGDLTSVDTWKQPAWATTATQNTYSLSKLAAVLFTGELNRRYGSTHHKIQSIAVNPGAVNSDIWRDYPRAITRTVNAALYLNNAQGCRTTVAACVLPTVVDNNNKDNPYPYLQPYWQPSSRTTAAAALVPVFPSLELIGPYQGYRWTAPRLPSDPVAASQALWTASQELTGAQWPVAL